MTFSIILILVFIALIVINYIAYKKIDIDVDDEIKHEVLNILFFIGIGITVLVMIVSSFNRRTFINKYNFCKVNPQCVTYIQLADINKEIIDINAYKGTIFSFYNDKDFELFDIDNVSNKVIIQH